KIGDVWDLLLDDLDFGDVLDIKGFDVSQFVCKMGKKAEREALAISICERYSLLEERRLVIKTMAYSDKYKKILDGICLDKMKLDGMDKEEEEAIMKIKGEALIEKDDPGTFVIPIRLEDKINLNALADTGSDINTLPYRVYKELGREDVQNVKKGITMLNHSKAKPIGLLKDVLCQVGVTTIIAKFPILDMPIDRDTLILVGRGFLHTCGGILNTIERITSTFDGIFHQTFCAAQTSLDTRESDSDDEEKTMRGNDNEAESSRPKCSCQYKTVEEVLLPQVHHEFLLWKVAAEMQNQELCHEFYSTYKFDDVCTDDDLKTKKILKFRLGGRAHSLTLLEFARRLGLYHSEELDEEGFDVYFQGGLRSDEHLNAQEYWLSISREENLSLSRSHASTI
ncbi:retrotransposon ORF1, partial [Tanacetum coccineum]